MSGKDFKLDTEDKKGSRSELQMTLFFNPCLFLGHRFLFYFLKGDQNSGKTEKKETERAMCAHSSNQTQFQGHKEKEIAN